MLLNLMIIFKASKKLKVSRYIKYYYLGDLDPFEDNKKIDEVEVNEGIEVFNAIQNIQENTKESSEDTINKNMESNEKSISSSPYQRESVNQLVKKFTIKEVRSYIQYI